MKRRITRRDFVKQAAITGASFSSLPVVLAACGQSTTPNLPSW